MNRKEELMDYIKILNSLREDFRCEKELSQAIKELHSLMIPKKEKMSIVVLERDLDNIEKSVEIFMNILGNDAKIVETHVNGRHIKNENTYVMIVDAYKIDNKLFNKLFRGRYFNYIINNTSDMSLPENLGIVR